MLLSRVQPSPKLLNNHFVIKNSVKILNQIRKHFALPGVSVYTPIAYNRLFKPGITDCVFSDWRRMGLRCIGDLYIDRKLASFAQLQAKFQLPQAHFFRYLQIRDFVREHIPEFIVKPKGHELYGLILIHPNSKHLVSSFVATFGPSVDSGH